MLKHFHRHRMPVDGTWVRTEASLDMLNRAINTYNDGIYHDLDDPSYRSLHAKLEDVWVPLWVKLERHKGQPSPKNPEAIYYHPVVRIGTAPGTKEIGLHNCYIAGLGQDRSLDGYENSNLWHYRPLDDYYMANAIVPPGEDTSQYECSICENVLYRDETGRRDNRSAMPYDGSLVCRDCEVDGAVYAKDVEDRLVEVRKLCAYIDKTCECSGESYRDPSILGGFNRQWDFLCKKTGWGKPNQTRVYLDGQWSFYWKSFILVEPGKKRVPDMNGGLIMHGPNVKKMDDGSYLFGVYDYDKVCDRPATRAEIERISWSIHT